MNKTSFQKIENWLEKRGYKIVFQEDVDWEVSFQKRTVKGDPRLYPKKNDMLAVLLHECGHVEQERMNKLVITKLPKKGKKANDSFYIGMLKREIDAWDEAERILEELQISNIKAAMTRMRNQCLMAYVEWAASRGDFEFLRPN